MNPYEKLPARSFWRPAVATPSPDDIADVWTPAFAVDPDQPVLTAGSCFAARLGPALLDQGLNWFETELPPPGLTASQRRAGGYGEFSFRTGNIYTPAMLRQWLAWACGHDDPPATAWEHDGRWYDPFRPRLAGHDSPAAVHAARAVTLDAIRAGLAGAGCLIVTMGLIETWQDRADGSFYPSCPGTVRGTFDPQRHVLRRQTFADAYADLAAAVAWARTDNPGLHVLFTVSPQPLTATATAEHALTANGYTKSLLRTATGQLALDDPGVDYFPAFELMTGLPFRSRHFGDNLRTVTGDGVAFVLRHFMTALAGAPAGPRPLSAPTGRDDCDDILLDYYGPR
ncbi:GSCFA domain-containing protein [Dactylosporangium sp. CA-092794]|uniref:GSCFA domain-containing protein n=1 Tax=Dactylosporangium sp. CA-092794 TaxID=3239929 RepID=UPI003D89C24A